MNKIIIISALAVAYALVNVTSVQAMECAPTGTQCEGMSSKPVVSVVVKVAQPIQPTKKSKNHITPVIVATPSPAVITVTTPEPTQPPAPVVVVTPEPTQDAPVVVITPPTDDTNTNGGCNNKHDRKWRKHHN